MERDTTRSTVNDESLTKRSDWISDIDQRRFSVFFKVGGVSAASVRRSSLSSDFLKQTMQVRYNPALHQLTTLHAVDGDALECNSPACGSDATEIALVCSEQSPPHHDLVTFRN